MSGTLNSVYNNISFALFVHTDAISRLQEQVTTGSRINRASDAPPDAYRVLGLNSNEKQLDNYLNNLEEVVSILEHSSIVITDISSALEEARVRVTQVISSVYDDESRERTAEGVNDILEQIVSLANTKHMNQYVFGGSSTDTAPYLVERTNGEITSVTYQGSLENRNIEVAPSVDVTAVSIGDNIFRSDERSDPVFIGDTGAKAGTGTSSVRGDTWLTVTGTAGSYELSIDDGLTTVPTDGTHTNLAVTDSRTGRILYVDTTQITNTGTDLVSIPGTYDIFNMLIYIRDILKNSKSLSQNQLQELQGNFSNPIQEISELLVQSEVSVGSKIGFLEDLKDSLSNLKYNAEDEATLLQQADIAEIAIDLSRREVLYQMSLNVAAKLLSMSLLDLIL